MRYRRRPTSEAEEVSEKNPSESDIDVDVVLCGDFNSLPSSAVYRFITEGSCDILSEINPAKRPSLEMSAIGALGGGMAGKEQAGFRGDLKVLIADEDLDRVARWLRSVGVDAAMFEYRNRSSRRTPDALSRYEVSAA
jgi:hypothetical protein